VLRFRWKSGSKRAGHIVWTDGMDMLVSDEFVRRIDGLSGWKTVPVQLEGEAHREGESYYYFMVTGTCGEFEQQKSVLLPRAGRAFDLYRGLCFAETKEQADFCMPANPSLDFTFASGRVCEALEPLRCNNVELIPCTEMLVQTWTYLAILEKSGLVSAKGRGDS
jgi:hypothetical protein